MATSNTRTAGSENAARRADGDGRGKRGLPRRFQRSSAATSASSAATSTPQRVTRRKGESTQVIAVTAAMKTTYTARTELTNERMRSDAAVSTAAAANGDSTVTVQRAPEKLTIVRA